MEALREFLFKFFVLLDLDDLWEILEECEQIESYDLFSIRLE